MDTEDSSAARGNRLRKLRQLAKLTSVELATKAGISRASVSYWENAVNNGITRKGAERIIQVLNEMGINCDFDWLWFGIGPFPTITSDNQYTSELMFNKYPTVLQKLIGNVDKEISLFLTLNKEAIIHKIEDSLMSPVFKPGDIVGGIVQPLSNIHDETNCIIRINQTLYARIVKNVDDGFTVDYYNKSKSEYLNVENVDKDYLVPIIRVWKY